MIIFYVYYAINQISSSVLILPCMAENSLSKMFFLNVGNDYSLKAKKYLESCIDYESSKYIVKT